MFGTFKDNSEGYLSKVVQARANNSISSDEVECSVNNCIDMTSESEKVNW